MGNQPAGGDAKVVIKPLTKTEFKELCKMQNRGEEYLPPNRILDSLYNKGYVYSDEPGTFELTDLGVAAWATTQKAYNTPKKAKEFFGINPRTFKAVRKRLEGL